LRRAWLSSHWLGLQLRRFLRLWPRLPQAFGSQHKAPIDQRKPGAAKHLALEQFQACDMPPHGPAAPGQGQPSFDGVIIVSETFGKPLQGHNGTLRDPSHPSIQLRTLTLAPKSGKGLGEIDGLGHVNMLRTQLGEQKGFVLGVRLLTTQGYPGGLAGCEEWLSGPDYDREGLLRRSLLRRLALRLAQPLGIAGDRRIAPRIAAPLDLVPQAQCIMAAGVPPFQEIRFIGIENTAAPVTAAHALRQGSGPEIAKHRTLADAQMGRNRMARQPPLSQAHTC
jgi:hypothetical protein